MNSIFDELSPGDIEKIRARAVRKTFPAGELIFAEGDAADYIYFIETGRVSISIQKFSRKEEIQTLGPGQYFGEMAVFFKDRRTASVTAMENSELLSIAKSEFLDLLETEQSLADQINQSLTQRNQALLLKEKLIDSTGIDGKNLHIGIKGDPSLRETAFSRERHNSIVDLNLPQLAPRLAELLLNRCVFQLYVGFNNGEIRTSSIFNPFGDEIHPVPKILDDAYLDRHFARIDYGRKARAIQRIYRTIREEEAFSELNPTLGKVFENYYDAWQPIGAQRIADTISRLHLLRDIPNFYLRNITVSTVTDAIHMQFNCDGTHIVSAEDYQRFLDENL